MTAVPTNRANERDDKIEGDVAERERAPAASFSFEERVAPGAASTERTNDLGIGASAFLPSLFPFLQKNCSPSVSLFLVVTSLTRFVERWGW